MRPLSASTQTERQLVAPLADAPSDQTPRAPAIVGGQEAAPGAWPWQVALVRGGSSNFYFDQGCGGSLIAPDWVITSAGCVAAFIPREIDVVAGIHDLEDPDQSFQHRKLSQIIVHPDYNRNTDENSIALLKLSTPIDERPGDGEVLPIAYVDLVPDDIGSLTGADVTITGWGNRAPSPPGGSDYPSTLHEAVVQVVSNEICDAAFTDRDVTEDMLCAGELGIKDACSGDGAGPLVYNNNGTWQLAGIVNWGIGCAHPDYYGVYTRVSHFIDWIESYVPVTTPEPTATPTATMIPPVTPTVGPSPTPGEPFVPTNWAYLPVGFGD